MLYIVPINEIIKTCCIWCFLFLLVSNEVTKLPMSFLLISRSFIAWLLGRHFWRSDYGMNREKIRGKSENQSPLIFSCANLMSLKQKHKKISNKNWMKTKLLYVIHMGYWPSRFCQDRWILAKFFFCVFMDREIASSGLPARVASHTQCEVRFILPAYGASHIIMTVIIAPLVSEIYNAKTLQALSITGCVFNDRCQWL